MSAACLKIMNLVWILTVASATIALAGTNVYIENLTGEPLTMVTEAPSGLPDDAWEQTRSRAEHGERTAFLWLGRDSGVTSGTWFYVNTTVKMGIHEVVLRQALLGEEINSRMWQSAGSEPYMRDRRRHHHSWILGDGRYIPVEYWAQADDNPVKNDDVYYVFHPARRIPESRAGEGLRLLAYNTYLKPNHMEAEERAEAMVPLLGSYDVLVLSEVFDEDARQILVEGLAKEYPHRSEVLDIPARRWQEIAEDSGVMILSRWPIVAEDQVEFTESSGTDALANKGAAYIAIDKGEVRYHIVGTHTQANKDGAEVRRSQFVQIQEMLQRRGIGPEDAVIIAGDLNVERADTGELNRMHHILGTVETTMVPGRPSMSYDPATNDLAEGPSEHLDYVLYSAHHLRPTRAESTILEIEKGGRDLSDHHAVSAFLLFGSEAVSGPVEPATAASTEGDDALHVLGVLGGK